MKSKAIGMVFNESGIPMKAQEFPIPKLKDSELLVKIKYATICGSDLHTYQGFRKTPVPTILGHEIIGEIETIPNDGPLKDYCDNER